MEDPNAAFNRDERLAIKEFFKKLIPTTESEMIKQIILCAVLMFARLACIAQAGKVYFIPTLHGIHKSNINYNYDSLKGIIASLKPDIIAVEIRAEDVGKDSAYLGKNYPYEMRMMNYWFPQTTITGFDWLGEDIEGKMIPANYWKEISPIKQYEKALREDAVSEAETAICDSFSQKRLSILRHSSLQELLLSDDAILTKRFYECLWNQLKGSIHERILKFYDLRNEKILNNINKVVADNPGKTIVILTGDDHYVLLKDRFKHVSLLNTIDKN